MKRNTTPTLGISINVDKDSIDSIEFLFKARDSEKAQPLLSKKYSADTMNVAKGTNNGELIFFLDFTAEETMKLPEGDIFMDTRIVTTSNKILETEIVSFDMKRTLFSEVYTE